MNWKTGYYGKFGGGLLQNYEDFKNLPAKDPNQIFTQ